MQNKKVTLGALATASLLIVGGAGYYIWHQHQTINELTEGYALEKEELQEEYSQLAIQYESYNQLNVNNDSLEQKLEDQRLKIQRLVEELKQTKADDARKIYALKKELASVREVLKYYVAQVDSLSALNEQLVAENTAAKQQIKAANIHNENLQKKNEELNKQVTLAAHLQAVSIIAKALNSREKQTESLKKTTAFRLDFTIAQNVTAEVGMKDIYVRILKPNEDIIVNDRSGKFSYDNAMIDYSMKKAIEYGGEETPVTLFWKRNETLNPGTYTFEIYADGNLIGTTRIKMAQ